MNKEQSSMVNLYDEIIDGNFSGENATKLKKKVRNSDVMVQERLLEIKNAEKIISELQDDKEYIEEQKFEIKCLVRELEGKPAEGTTDEEKEEFRKYHPNTMSDEQLEIAKQNASQMKIR